MTAAAQQVLADCRAALEMLDEERDEQRWRVLWIGAMALLRAVGHVLQKVDGEVPDHRAAIDAAYKRWTNVQLKHAVFRHFIEEERNNILKEYRLNVLDSGAIDLVVVYGDKDADYVTDESPFVLDENLFRPVIDGFGVGEDARDVYREAIDWWDTELFHLEMELNSSQRQGVC